MSANSTPQAIKLRNAERLAGVHPVLVAVVRGAEDMTPISVVEGVRTLKRQELLFAQGRTTPGLIVTKTMNSKHLVQADGFGHAVDLVPYKNRASVDWSDLAAFDRVALAMFRAAAQRGVLLRWGADWDRDGKPREPGESDSPHFELMQGK